MSGCDGQPSLGLFIGSSVPSFKPNNVNDRLQYVVSAISRYKFAQVPEDEIQIAIMRTLVDGSVPFEREVILSDRDRIDFIAHVDIGIEVKVGGGTTSVLRQLARYAESPLVSALLLVTTLNRHQMPAILNEKPLMTLYVGRPFG